MPIRRCGRGCGSSGADRDPRSVPTLVGTANCMHQPTIDACRDPGVGTHRWWVLPTTRIDQRSMPTAIPGRYPRWWVLPIARINQQSMPTAIPGRYPPLVGTSNRAHRSALDADGNRPRHRAAFSDSVRPGPSPHWTDEQSTSSIGPTVDHRPDLRTDHGLPAPSPLVRRSSGRTDHDGPIPAARYPRPFLLARMGSDARSYSLAAATAPTAPGVRCPTNQIPQRTVAQPPARPNREALAIWLSRPRHPLGRIAAPTRLVHSRQPNPGRVVRADRRLPLRVVPVAHG